MYCSNCGNQLPENAHICMNCGCAAPSSPSATSHHGASSCASTHSGPCSCSAGSSVPVSEYSANGAKRGVVALVLLLVLGVFGAHRFYLRRPVSAIFMCLLFLSCYLPFMIYNFTVAMWSMAGDYNSWWFSYGGAPIFTLIGFTMIPIAIWWIVDLVVLLTGKFKDGDGNYVAL